MNIVVEKAGKKFYKDWIFRDVNISLNSNDSLAILGPNGSGKSTLLQMLAGIVTPSEGKITYSIDNVKLEPLEVFRYIGFASPYLELIEEFTLTEIVQTHFKFKKPVSGFSLSDIIAATELESSSEKVFKYFSSGMKQRVKLTLALLSDVPLILIDEPTSNLDKNAVKWYRSLVEKFTPNKLVIVCSNHQPDEYDFCKQTFSLMNNK
jgi:ABC-type multidrug transport system ATPase subunit